MARRSEYLQDIIEDFILEVDDWIGEQKDEDNWTHFSDKDLKKIEDEFGVIKKALQNFGYWEGG